VWAHYAVGVLFIIIIIMVVFLIIITIIIVYRIFHITGCNFVLMTSLLQPNLCKGDELCTFRTIQKVLEIEHIPNKIREYLTLTSQDI